MPLRICACGVFWTLDGAVPRDRRAAVDGRTPLLSVQNTPLRHRACGVFWTLDGAVPRGDRAATLGRGVPQRDDRAAVDGRLAVVD
ncbi:hypothetical protein, partial [Microbacterium proteolyticum]|uniref:hypothetical protein n=1 Tax=Microbacterium proteolyticum TaxID=1572644 RepID=UPI001FAE098E